MNMVSTAYQPDESNIGVWAWVILIIGVNAYWITFDLWARSHNHEYMTTEFREGINHPLFGPLILGLVAFTVVAFLVHMFNVNVQP
jgi:hypothetical protein